MACAHETVGDEPTFVARITKMAGQALFSACDRLVGRVEPGVEVRFMAGAGEVDAQPFFSGAMTGLATDPVRNFEARSPPRFWYVISVAVETDLGCNSIREPKIACDPDPALVAQHGVRPMVLIDPILIGFLRPNKVFVLHDRRMLGRFYCAVTIIPRARLNPEVLGVAVLGLRVGPGRNRQRQGDESRDSDLMQPHYRNFALHPRSPCPRPAAFRCG